MPRTDSNLGAPVTTRRGPRKSATRKRGQATFAVWLPDGSCYEEKTTANHTAVEFAPVLAAMIERLQRELGTVETLAEIEKETPDE
jgi:hypothetical protein